MGKTMSLIDKDAYEVGGVVAGAVGFFWFLITKVRRQWTSDNKAIVADDASIAVVELLRAEVTRLAASNNRLQELVESLQYQVSELQRENHYLRSDMNGIKDARKNTVTGN